MGNIWEFFLQTVTVSMAAVLILVLKGILKEHLSPRWQYGVWSVLALRILVPADILRSVLVDVSLWLETLKTNTEWGLGSAYTNAFSLTKLSHVLPWVTEAPVSWTDWLFAAYCAGVVVSLALYTVSYLRLRAALRRAYAAPSAQVSAVAQQYGLKECPAVVVPGLDSAFVCGVVRPVLVLPEEMPDDKVILHELLHLKHWDGLQNTLWCALRCLHWCNPFLQYVFNRIGNDMEALCDQRVLERLEGEERREYGKILLSMTSKRYARAPGTSSISNGGRNIARRIDAIVRFRKYPQGMALVAVCIVVILFQPLVVGGSTIESQTNDRFFTNYPSELPGIMARARLTRCTGAVGAFHAYANSLLSERGTVLATVLPEEEHEALVEQMIRTMEEEHIVPCYLDSGWELSTLGNREYGLFDLTEREDGVYAQMAIPAVRVNPPETDPWLGILRDEEGNPIQCTVMLTLRAWQQDGKWVVEETEERVITESCIPDPSLLWDVLEPVFCQKVEGPYGAVTLKTHTTYQVEPESGYSGSLNGFNACDYTVHPEPEYRVLAVTYVEYEVNHDVLTDDVGFSVQEIWDLDNPDTVYETVDGNGGGSATGMGFDNHCHRSSSVEVWTRGDNMSHRDTLGGWFETRTQGLRSQPEGYRVRFYLNGALVQEQILEVTP